MPRRRCRTDEGESAGVGSRSIDLPETFNIDVPTEASDGEDPPEANFVEPAPGDAPSSKEPASAEVKETTQATAEDVPLSNEPTLPIVTSKATVLP